MIVVPVVRDAKYKRCCLGNEELFPHFQFSLEEQTATPLPPLEVCSSLKAHSSI